MKITANKINDLISNLNFISFEHNKKNIKSETNDWVVNRIIFFPETPYPWRKPWPINRIDKLIAKTNKFWFIL